MIKLVASRLEGLLLNSKGKMDLTSFQRRLNHLQKYHAQMVLMSQFSYPYLLNKFQSITGPLNYVAENGAEVVINGVNVKERLLDAVLLSRILTWFNKRPEFAKATITLSSRANTITNAKLHSQAYSRLRRIYPNVTSAPDLLMVASQIYQIRVDLPQKKTHLHQMLIQEHFNQQLQIISYGAHCFYLLAPEANFADGLALIQKRLGVRNRQTAAMGKFPMDFGYLNAAKYSFAPQDADPSVRGICQPLNQGNQGSVMKEIDQLMKQK